MRLLYSLFRPVCNLLTVIAAARRYPDLRLFPALTRHYALRRKSKKGGHIRGISVPVVNLLFSTPWGFALSHYHEVGHCRSDDGFHDNNLEAEYAAWAWALHELAIIKELPTWHMSYNDAFMAFRHYATYCFKKSDLEASYGAMDSLQRLFTYYIKRDLNK